MNRKIGVAVLWNLVSLFLNRGASTIFTLLLARLLTPESFGLVAMVTVVFELANVFVSSGLGQALIQSKSVSDEDLSTVFYTNLALSCLAYGLLFLTAPLIADFYRQTNLELLVQIMGLVVFLNATKVVQIAILSRAMNFKAQMKADAIGTIGSGILGVTAAYIGWGVWSLVIMMLSQAAISSLLLWIASNWRPIPHFDTASFFRLFRFGRNLLAEGMLGVLYQNSYILVIGRFFSAEITGLYFLAKKISNLVSQQITGAVQKATFPAFSTLQDSDEILRHKYRQVLQLMAFLVAPIMGFLASLASPLFALLFDETWQDAVPYLQLLCVVGALYPLHALNVNLMNVKGRSDLVLKVGLVKKAINMILLGASLKYGVLAIAASQVFGSILALIPNAYYSEKLIKYGILDQIKDIMKPALCACVAAALVRLLMIGVAMSPALTLAIGFVVGLISYVLANYLVKAEGLLMCSQAFRKNLKKAR